MDGFGPFNIRVMDPSGFIKAHQLKEVSSLLVREPSSVEFNSEGLFSEEIFGRVGTLDRLLTHGYIELNTTIIAPVLFRVLTRMGTLYQGIMAGKVYATFNPETKDFERVTEDPEEVEGANTGFAFFTQHLKEFTPKITESLSRELRVELIDKYRDIALYGQYLVHPAGLRDISVDTTGKLIQDDLNKIYTTLIAYTKSIPPNSTSPLYDSIRYAIQLKCMEVYEYLLNIMTGKRGYFRGSYTSRRIAKGTRNVISATSYSSLTPDDPRYLLPDETYVGVWQTMKGCEFGVYHCFKQYFSTPIFGDDGTAQSVPVINKKTYDLEYVDVAESERLRYTSEDGITSLINNFENYDMREKPITIKTQKGEYYLMMVYDDFESVVYFRSLDDLKVAIPNYNKANIRPLTWVELFYIFTYEASYGKYAYLTRYPVMGAGSVYPTKIHLVTTSPGRVVKLVDMVAPGTPSRVYPEYPNLGQPHRDTVALSSSMLAGLGADFDKN